MIEGVPNFGTPFLVLLKKYISIIFKIVKKVLDLLCQIFSSTNPKETSLFKQVSFSNTAIG